MPEKHPHNSAPVLLRKLLASWFTLNWDEQKIIMVILAIFLLGIAARYWHTRPPAAKRTPAQPEMKTE